MAVGSILSYTTVISGHVTLTLADAGGNIKAVRRHSNQMNTLAKKIWSSCAHNGGAGVSALYAYVWSAMAGTPTLSMPAAFSAYGHPSLNYTNQPATLTWSFHNDVQWSVNGTMKFLGYALATCNAAALCWMATTSAASWSFSQWWAQASFTAMAVLSTDTLAFNWVFSISVTTSTAP